MTMAVTLSRSVLQSTFATIILTITLGLPSVFAANFVVTTELAAGGEWREYAVRVELDRDGETLSRDLSVKLAGGESQELVVDPDSLELAGTVAP